MFTLIRRTGYSLRPTRCLSTSVASYQGSPNQGLLEAMEKYKQAESYSPTRNPYKIAVFSRVINQIVTLEEPIKSVADLDKLRRAGPAIRSCIAAYLSGNMLDPDHEKVFASRQKEMDEAKTVLRSVRGITPIWALRLVTAGCERVEQLREPRFFNMLPFEVKTHISMMDHWEKKATRSEAEMILGFMKDLIPEGELHLAGPYRRGRDTFDSIDVVIAHPAAPEPIPPRFRTVNQLFTPILDRERENIVATLSERGLYVGAVGKGRNLGAAWHSVGWIRLPQLKENGKMESVISRRDNLENRNGEFRLLRFSVIPRRCLGGALISYTGDENFVGYLRNFGHHFGMHVSDQGLWQWRPESESGSVFPNKGDPGNWVLLPSSSSEEEIMKELGAPFVPPEKRNFAYLEKPLFRQQRSRKVRPLKILDPTKPRLGRPPHRLERYRIVEPGEEYVDPYPPAKTTRKRKPKPEPEPEPKPYTDEQVARWLGIEQTKI